MTEMEFDSEIHRQYSCSQWCKEFSPELAIENHIKIVQNKSICNLKTFQHETQFYAGDNSTQENRFHFFRSNGISKKLVIYLHGGYWQVLDLDSSVFLAKFFVEKNYNFAGIGYNLCPSVSMRTIIGEIRKGLKVLMNRYPDIDEIFLSGHSCGAQLALMGITFDGFEKELLLSIDEERKFKGLILISGIYDLRPLCQTGENINLKLSLDEAWEFSPIRCIDKIKYFGSNLRILILVAENDSPSFIAQSDKFNNEIRKYVKSKIYLVNNKDHFSIIQDIGDVGYFINNVIMDFLQFKSVTGHLSKS